VLFQVGHAILTSESAVHNQHAHDASVVNELGAHRARFAVHDQPRAAAGDTAGRGVAHNIHLGVVATDLNSRAARNLLRIAQALIATAQLASAARSTVVAVHQDHVAFRVDQKCAKFSSWTVRGLGQSETLRHPNRYVFVLHGADTNVRDMDELAGKTAVVTGGASGIGLAMGAAFASRGMNVVLADIEAGPLHEAAERLGAFAVRTDVSDEASVAALRDAALDRFGRVNVLCNNAGVGGGGPIAELSLESWKWTLGVNLWGVVHGVHHFLPHLVSHGDGHIVNTASIAGILSFPYMAAYNVSKHAVVTLSETLYQELLQSASSVGVTVLCPGFVNTRIIESDRNLPEDMQQPLAEADPMREQLRAVVSDLYAKTKPPAEVADLVIEAITAKRLYCFTDEAFAGEVADHHRNIESATNPRSVGTLFDRLAH
jgi:NAD(P)-dependent dehydrogenase (short-subunit alcohol dehydrogenase family)